MEIRHFNVFRAAYFDQALRLHTKTNTRPFEKICYRLELPTIHLFILQALEMYNIILEACNGRKYTKTEHFIKQWNIGL